MTTQPSEPVVPVTRAKASGAARLVNLALGVALLVAAAGVAFAAGRATAPAAAATGPVGLGDGAFPGRGSFAPGVGPGASGAPGGLGLRGGLSVEGTVESVTADAVTLTTASGQTITIGLSDETAYHRQAGAAASDVEAGTTVIVRVGEGLRPGTGGTGGTGGTSSMGDASDVTIVP
jgi:hypothetical protein